jgi:hypothetical protein
MTRLKLLSAAAILSALAAAPSLAQAADLPVHLRAYSLPYPISYSHNYGPGPQPGTFAYYDGPSTNACRQSAATYLGQDRRKHPCF